MVAIALSSDAIASAVKIATAAHFRFSVSRSPIALGVSAEMFPIDIQKLSGMRDVVLFRPGGRRLSACRICDRPKCLGIRKSLRWADSAELVTPAAPAFALYGGSRRSKAFVHTAARPLSIFPKRVRYLGLKQSGRTRRGTRSASRIHQSSSPASLRSLHHLICHIANAPHACFASGPHYRPGVLLSCRTA